MSDGKWEIRSGSEAMAQSYGSESNPYGLPEVEICKCTVCGQQFDCTKGHICSGNPGGSGPPIGGGGGGGDDGGTGSGGNGGNGGNGGHGGGNSTTYNCTDVFGKSGNIDFCGQCTGGTTGKQPCTMDCNNVWGGTAYKDNCGQCVGGNTGKQPCVKDCNNVWGGTAYKDNCGLCVGGSTGKQPCVKDCNNVWGGTAYKDDCGQCVGGNTGKQPCVQDCSGVWGGTAYTRVCGGETYCIDGNQGVVDNHLKDAILNQFNIAKEGMLLNCLRTALWNNLDKHYGINISTGNGAAGTFNPCDYSISFNPNEIITELTLSAELFHAYQEQFLGGKLSQIGEDTLHKGGSNIEFEETAMGILAGKIGLGGGEAPATAKLDEWCEQFLKDHPMHSAVVLTQLEQNSWFEAMEEFRTYYIDHPTPGTSMYRNPIDYNMLPTSLLSLWELSDCDFNKY